MSFEMNAEFLSAIVGAVVSAVFSYVPKLNTMFAALPENTKKLIMLGLMVLASGIIYLGQCSLTLWTTDIVCGKEGVWRLATILVMAVIGNQGAFRIEPQTKSVIAAKVD